MDDPQTQSQPTYTIGDPKQIPGMIEPGNIDLSNRPIIQNDDGTHSSEFSTSFGTDKGEVLVPTIVNGKFLTSDGKKPKPGSQEEKNLLGYEDNKGVFHKGTAQKYYEKTGQHLGIFDKPEHADTYAQIVHNRKMDNSQNSGIPRPMTNGTTDQGQSQTQAPPPPEGAVPITTPTPPPPPAGAVPITSTSDNQELINRVNDYNTNANAFTPLQSTLSGLPPEIQVTEDIAEGAIKGAGQTVSTLGKVANNVLLRPGFIDNPLADKIDRALKALDQHLTPEGTAQKVGAVAEGIGEFLIGDEALKGLSFADRLGLTKQIAELTTKYPKAGPFLVKVLGRGLQAVRGGAVTTGQQLLHGATPGEALKTGAEGAAIGTGVGALIEGGSLGIGKLADFFKDTTSAEPNLTPADTAAQKATQKVRLPEGEEGQAATKIKTPKTTEMTIGPQGTMHEPILQQGIRQKINDLMKSEGLKPVGDTVDLRDVAKEASDQFYARSKAGFDEIKNATGVDLNVLRDQISDLYDKRAEIFNDPEKEGAIIEKINDLEDEADAAIQKAQDAGIDTEKPLQDWKKMKAANDFGATLRASVDPHIKSGTLTTKYTPRLEKMYRVNPKYPNQPGRLGQLFGKDAAESLRDEAYAADETQQAIKNFKPVKTTTGGETIETPEIPPTESKALYDMVRKNTSRRWGVLDERTNWGKVYKQFDEMSPADRAARFSNPREVEQMILKQARNQRYRMIAGGIGAAAIAGTFGIGPTILRKILGE